MLFARLVIQNVLWEMIGLIANDKRQSFRRSFLGELRKNVTNSFSDHLFFFVLVPNNF